MSSIAVFDHPEFDTHEQVLFCHDTATGLRAIIAVHNTNLGPAAGGCRMHPYATVDEALTDVLRLSRGMSYKNSLAGLPLGGGKAVIIADPTHDDKPALLRAFARHVQSLNGRYWSSMDVGVSPADVDVLAQGTDFTFARASEYPQDFNPAEFTVLGGFSGIRAVAKHTLGRDDLAGVRVAVQGLGNTGRGLSRMLHEAGAQLVVADVVPEAVEQVVRDYGATAVDTSEIHAQDVDIFAPCALGGVINDETLPQLKAKAVCGIANNQLAQPHHAEDLRARGITYAPDYLVNAGGVIGATQSIFGTQDIEASNRQIEGIYTTLLEVLNSAKAQDRSPAEVADELALDRITQAG